MNNEEKVLSEKITLNYPVFDGNRVWEAAKVVIENGAVSDETVLGEGRSDSKYFLMPGLIDAHTHTTTKNQIQQLLVSGITTTCDVAIPKKLKDSLQLLNVHTSYIMAFGTVSDGKAYVENAVAKGADYIKVILEKPARMAPGTMDFHVLCDIVKYAHQHNLKVAAHAVTIPMAQMAVDAGIDILIHAPMREEFPAGLAEQIAEKNIAVVPTLVMMETFAKAAAFGYKTTDYLNAEAAVWLLHSKGVLLLAGTDANESTVSMKVAHGSSMHHELELLVQAGLTPLEALKCATGNIAEAFGLNGVGTIVPGNRADMVLVEGRPDQMITDSTKIKQIWIAGKPVL